MIPEWIPVTSPWAGLAGLLIWLVRAVVTGQLVSGRQMEALLSAQQDIITSQNDQINKLLTSAKLTNRVIEALPRAATTAPAPTEASGP